MTDAFKLGGDMLFVSNQFFVGDDSNQQPDTSQVTRSSTCVGRTRSTKRSRCIARIDNVFDRRYSTLGTFFETDDVPNFAKGGADFTDPRTVSPARPRGFLCGLEGDVLAGTVPRYARICPRWNRQPSVNRACYSRERYLKTG